jgi:hypothetical protein
MGVVMGKIGRGRADTSVLGLIRPEREMGRNTGTVKVIKVLRIVLLPIPL